MNAAAFISFKKNNITADHAFECSSEGELEQIIPLLNYLLESGKNVELIYCSESVHHKCMDLYQKNSKRLRLYKLPILTYFPLLNDPRNWITAKDFYLCRYDFFPELIFYGKRKDVHFTLLWAMGREKRGFANWYNDYVFRSFNSIIAATAKDKFYLESRYKLEKDQIEAFDFRPIQIATRLQDHEKTLKGKFPFFDEFQQFITKYPTEQRLIFGSFWDNELKIFDSSLSREFLAKYLVAIVPHNLSKENILLIKSYFSVNEIPVYEIHSNITQLELEELFVSYLARPGVILINLKGVLCELYKYFALSFVGGGHGISIHSVMEPYIAGCRVFCGPKVFRSTEFQFIQGRAPDKISIIENLDQFFTFIYNDLKLEYKSTPVLLEDYNKDFNNILNWMGLKE